MKVMSGGFFGWIGGILVFEFEFVKEEEGEDFVDIKKQLVDFQVKLFKLF